MGGLFFRFKDQKNTVVHVVESLADPKDEDSDILGGKGDLTSLLRLMTIRRKGRADLRIIANDAFKSTEEIGNLYDLRWQIELFFKYSISNNT